MLNNKPVPGSGGNHYVPFEERTGDSSLVFFTQLQQAVLSGFIMV